MNITFEQAIIFLPLITALVTFLLTSIFTLYRESKNRNIHNRLFFEYNEFVLMYPFFNNPAYGEGKVLLGKNGMKLKNDADKNGEERLNFFVIKNVTENNAVHVKIKNKISNRIDNKEPSKIVEEAFFIPVWKWEETLYIPNTMWNGDSVFSANEEFTLEYYTESFEKFEYSISRSEKNKYEEKLRKQYFRCIWITILKYKESEFFNIENVKDK